MIDILFWIGICLILYTYLGYTVLLFLLNLLSFRLWRKPKPFFNIDDLPEVSILIAAYNEAEIVDAKMQNTMELDYPADKIHVVWITDGSNDGTPDLIKKYPNVQVLHTDAREGKTAALNRAMPYIKTPFTIFCDANTQLDSQAAKELILGFTDEKIGCVAGEKRIQKNTLDSAAGSGEGAYWQYESIIKILESRFYSALAAAGELYAIRTDLFVPVDKKVIIDDFFISLNIATKGYRIRYVPGAFALELASANITEELKRKIRIASGGFQTIVKMPALLNVFRYGFLSFEFISHKFLRWAVVPFSLPMVLLLNIWLAYSNGWQSAIFNLLFLLQAIFYILVIIGLLFENRSTRFKQLFLPYYIIVINFAQLAGLIRFIRKKQNAAWEKAKRSQS